METQSELEQKKIALSRKINPAFKINAKDKQFVTPSWADAHKFADEAIKWVEVQEGLAKEMAATQEKISSNFYEAFRRAPIVDCSYGEGPISPPKQIYYLKAFLKKLGWPGVTIRDVAIPTVEIEPYSAVMAKAIKWLFKFENEETKKPTK